MGLLGNKNQHDKKEDNKPEKEEAGVDPQEIKEDSEPLVIEKSEYEQLKTDADKAKEYYDRLLRQQADFDNIRKRFERDKAEFQKYAHEDIVFDLLGILDDLERSVEAAELKQENFEAFLKGIEMILAHLYELLKQKGVEPIVAKGKKFDPHQHEALMQTETNDHEDQEVLEELQKGYKIGDRIVRTSKVRVAKKIEKN
jgi:molecular chaperone GrpE